MDKDNLIAEFTRASGRGLRRVKNVVQDAKGMCKKKEHAAWPSDELPKKTMHTRDKCRLR
jgi:hypothetical protein